MTTAEPGPDEIPAEETGTPDPPTQAPPDPPEEGDEPEVERAETLHLPARQWVFLWAVPIVVAIAILVIVIAITNP
ncbi:MAG: hypothetical protein ABSG36_06415 [Acidimicrobiales bacterium]|jgi:hypothetical protein